MSTESRGPGVWDTDAPDGYVGIVVYGTDRLLMKLEIHRAVYRPEIVGPLQSWVESQIGPRLLR